MINSLISFINSLIYSVALAEIYKTSLSPYISYLHEPGTRRFSLSLDITEIFKPLIVDRMLFSMLNKNQITINSRTTRDLEYRSHDLGEKCSDKLQQAEIQQKRK